MGHFDEAIRWFDRSLASDREYARVHSMRGVVFYTQRQYEPAAEATRRAITLEPKEPSHTKNLALILHDAGRDQDDVVAWRELCARAPKAEQGWAGLVRCLEQLDRNAEALTAVREGISSLPESSQLHVALARLLLGAEDRDGAIGALNRALELDPDRKDAAKLRATLEQLEVIAK